MARIRIRTTEGGGPFGLASRGIDIAIDADEALPSEDFTNVIGTLTVTAQTIIGTLNGDDDEPEARPVVVVRVPADQVEAVSALNQVPSEDFPNGGLLIVPANWDEAPLPDDRPTFPMEDAAGTEAGCA